MPAYPAALSGATARPARRVVRRSSLMNVGRRVDYALRALCYLAAQPAHRVTTRAEIQKHQAVPRHFLCKILRRLVAAGILESVPGAHGGFRLGRPAGMITVRAVYECVEGDLRLIDCVERHDASCCYTLVCPQREVWRGAQQVLIEYLDRISIGELADEQGLVARLQRANRNPMSRR